MALTLRADPGCDAHLAAGLDLDLGALVRPDAGALDVTDDANTDVLALRAQLRLLLAHEPLVVDQFQQAVEDRLVVATVVLKLGEILEDDLVVEGKRVRRDEVSPANLRPVDIQRARRDIEQPFDHEHAVLPARAAVGCNDRLVGEDRREGAVVGRNDVGAEDGALAVDRHRQAIGVVGPGVVQEHVLDSEDLPVLRKGDLGVVDLSALLRRREKMLPPVFDPLDGTIELYRRPGNQDLFRVVHQQLGAEAAADKRGDHPHLCLAEPQQRGQTVS